MKDFNEHISEITPIVQQNLSTLGFKLQKVDDQFVIAKKFEKTRSREARIKFEKALKQINLDPLSSDIKIKQSDVGSHEVATNLTIEQFLDIAHHLSEADRKTEYVHLHFRIKAAKEYSEQIISNLKLKKVENIDGEELVSYLIGSPIIHEKTGIIYAYNLDGAIVDIDKLPSELKKMQVKSIEVILESYAKPLEKTEKNTTVDELNIINTKLDELKKILDNEKDPEIKKLAEDALLKVFEEYRKYFREDLIKNHSISQILVKILEQNEQNLETTEQVEDSEPSYAVKEKATNDWENFEDSKIELPSDEELRNGFLNFRSNNYTKGMEYLRKTHNILDSLVFLAIREQRFNEMEMLPEISHESLSKLIDFTFSFYKSILENSNAKDSYGYFDSLLMYKPDDGLMTPLEHLEAHLPELKELFDPELLHFCISKKVLTSKQLKDLAQNHLDKFELLTSPQARKAYTAGISYEQIKNLTDQQIKLLISDSCLETFQTKKVSFNELLSLTNDIERFKLLTSFQVAYALRAGIPFDKIKDLPREKFQLYTSDNFIATFRAILSFQKNKFSFDDFTSVSSDKEKFDLLTSREALEIFEAGMLFKDIKDLPKEEIRRLILWNSLVTIKTKKVSSSDLASIASDKEKFDLLTSHQAVKAYKAGIPLSEIKDLPIDIIQLMISDDSIATISTRKVPFNHLKSISEDIDKLKLLISYQAIKAYIAGISCEQIKNLTDQQIKLLISDSCLETFQTKTVSFDELLSLTNDIERLEILTSFQVAYALKAGVPFDKIKNLPNERISKLLSYQPISTLEKQLVTFDQLLSVVADDEKLTLLTSRLAIRLYQYGKVPFEDIKSLNNHSIKRMIESDNVIHILENEILSFEQLLDVVDDEDKFNLLKSSNAIKAYRAGIPFDKIKYLPNEQIKRLISTDSVETLKTEKVTFEQLLSIAGDDEKFEALTSDKARMVYANGAVFNQLEHLSKERIERLASYNAIETVKTEKVTFEQLLSIVDDANKFKTLTSYDARNTYNTNKVSFEDLKNLPNEKIKLLISTDAINAYKGGKNPADYLDEFKKAKKETHKALKKLLEHCIETCENSESFVSAINKALPENMPDKEKKLILDEAKTAFKDLKDYRSKKHPNSFLKLLNTITQPIVGLFGTNKLSEFANKINDSLTLQVLDEKIEDQGKPKSKFASKLDESRKNIPKNSNIPSP